MNENKPVLVAISHDWSADVCKFLQDENFSVLVATSQEEAAHFIQTQPLTAVVVISDWVMADATVDLMALIGGKIPTVTVISWESYQQFGHGVYHKVFNSGMFQEYCTAPFDREELLVRLKNMILKSKQTNK